jgi:hypothetical protein
MLVLSALSRRHLQGTVTLPDAMAAISRAERTKYFIAIFEVFTGCMWTDLLALRFLATAAMARHRLRSVTMNARPVGMQLATGILKLHIRLTHHTYRFKQLVQAHLVAREAFSLHRLCSRLPCASTRRLKIASMSEFPFLDRDSDTVVVSRRRASMPYWLLARVQRLTLCCCTGACDISA